MSGGARGMGANHAKELVAEGAKVVIGDVLVDEGRKLAAELGAACTFVELDVTKDEAWKAAVAAAEKDYGKVNLLVNDAGIAAYGTVDGMATEDFKRVIDINLTGVFLGMKYTVPSMRAAGGGVIVNISSTAGMITYANLSAYVASKWGVRGMTKTAAMEQSKHGIRVVSIHPGVITTPMTAGTPSEVFAGQPIPRAGTVDEVTKLLFYIAKDATHTTGCEFVIDGG
ncbi:MAG: SDR family oxidoreductase [Trueperaceae bacterium]|nr:SDR family oxidoreductase [Trueperaceae bacterium]